MKYSLKLCCALFLATLMTGCCAFRPHCQSMTINTQPSGAKVWVNNNYRGLSPVTVSVARNRTVAIMARKEGFDAAAYSVGNHFSSFAVLDVAGTILWLVPGIGLFTPGAFDLDETNVNMTLFERQK